MSRTIIPLLLRYHWRRPKVRGRLANRGPLIIRLIHATTAHWMKPRTAYLGLAAEPSVAIAKLAAWLDAPHARGQLFRLFLALPPPMIEPDLTADMFLRAIGPRWVTTEPLPPLHRPPDPDPVPEPEPEPEPDLTTEPEPTTPRRCGRPRKIPLSTLPLWWIQWSTADPDAEPTRWPPPDAVLASWVDGEHMAALVRARVPYDARKIIERAWSVERLIFARRLNGDAPPPGVVAPSWSLELGRWPWA